MERAMVEMLTLLVVVTLIAGLSILDLLWVSRSRRAQRMLEQIRRHGVPVEWKETQ